MSDQHSVPDHGLRFGDVVCIKDQDVSSRSVAVVVSDHTFRHTNSPGIDAAFVYFASGACTYDASKLRLTHRAVPVEKLQEWLRNIEDSWDGDMLPRITRDIEELLTAL